MNDIILWPLLCLIPLALLTVAGMIYSEIHFWDDFK